MGKISQELQSEIPESPLRLKLRGLAKTISKIGYCGAILASISYLFSCIVIDNNFDYDLIMATLTDFPSNVQSFNLCSNFISDNYSCSCS